MFNPLIILLAFNIHSNLAKLAGLIFTVTDEIFATAQPPGFLHNYFPCLSNFEAILDDENKNVVFLEWTNPQCAFLGMPKLGRHLSVDDIIFGHAFTLFNEDMTRHDTFKVLWFTTYQSKKVASLVVNVPHTSTNYELLYYLESVSDVPADRMIGAKQSRVDFEVRDETPEKRRRF
jgi:hypothetical protein